MKDISSIARVLPKIHKGEEFTDEDWKAVAGLTVVAIMWLYDTSQVKVTPDTCQVHIQPVSKKERRKKKR